MTAPDAALVRAALADLFARHERVFLAFSGGKDSATLLHLSEPYRDHLTLLWVDTGHMAAHMADHVRACAEGYDLIELHPAQPMMENWRERGVPTDILPIEHVPGVGIREPRLQPWLACCETHRTRPIITYLEQHGSACAFLTGQRRQDNGATVPGLTAAVPSSVEVTMPLWNWTDADVLAFVAENGITLPPHHAVCATSVECICCPANLSVEKMNLLDDLYPEAAAFIRSTVLNSLAAAGAMAREILATITPQKRDAA